MIRFKMSGRTFAWDPDARPTAADLIALDDAGIDPAEAGALLAAAAQGQDPQGLGNIRVLRALCALAYLSAIRAGSSESWREFTRSVHPDSIEFLPDPAPAAPAVTQQAEPPSAQAAPADLADAVLRRLSERTPVV